MPVDNKKDSTFISQRVQYQKGGIGRWNWDHRDRMIFSLIDPAHHSIVDIGCGEGITLEKLIRTYPGKNISGIDIMPENISICSEQGLPVSPGSVYDLKLEEGSVDLCILSEVIEHLDDAERALDNIKKALKPGGDIIIVFPNDTMFKLTRLLFLKFKEAFAESGHVRQYTPGIVKGILEKKGFTVLKVMSIPFKFWPLSLHGIVLARKK
jgi:2-polyprenyl-3-methyl-5-hydroxy-6-metoxy-1,4-benzoquinol methylase